MILTDLITDDNVYLREITDYAGPNNLPFVCKELYIAFIPMMFYGESVSADVASLIIHFGTDKQRHRLFCCLNKSIIKILLRMDDLDPGYRNSRALRLAARNDRIDIVKILLKDGRVDVDANDGDSLVFAVRNNNKKMINLLLDHDARVIDYRPIVEAIRNRSLSLVKFFLDITTKSRIIIKEAIATDHEKIILAILNHPRHGKYTITDDITMLALNKITHVGAMKKIIGPALNFIEGRWMKGLPRKTRFSDTSLIIAAAAMKDLGLVWPQNMEKYILGHYNYLPKMTPLFELIQFDDTDDLKQRCLHSCNEIACTLIENNVDLWCHVKTFKEVFCVTLPYIQLFLHYDNTIPTFVKMLDVFHDSVRDKRFYGTENYDKKYREFITSCISLVVCRRQTDNQVMMFLDKTIDHICPSSIETIVVHAINNDHQKTIQYIVFEKGLWKFGVISLSALCRRWMTDKSSLYGTLIKYVYWKNPNNVPMWIEEAIIMFSL